LPSSRPLQVVNMEEKQLEFRGINLHELMSYIKDIGGLQKTNSFPYVFKGADWSIEIVEERAIKITSTFEVNAVFIKFSADTEEMVEELIKQYRKKTFRAGG
jgi:hypothetical protein